MRQHCSPFLFSADPCRADRIFGTQKTKALRETLARKVAPAGTFALFRRADRLAVAEMTQNKVWAKKGRVASEAKAPQSTRLIGPEGPTP